MIAITPDEFSAAALAWIGALTIVGGAVAVSLAKLVPMGKQIALLFELHKENKADIKANTEKIVDVALAVPPAPPPAPSLDRPID